MDEALIAVAQDCLTAAESDTLAFPEIVGRLIEAGFDGYLVDYRRGTTTYYLPDGDCVALGMHADEVPVAESFDSTTIVAAIKAAQTQAAGYTYRGFSATVKAAGCAGYLVSFLGQRVLYFGRTGETHVEHFPT